MSPRLAILCPGQGGQHAAMFDLVRDDPSSDIVLQRALAGVLQQRPLQSVLDDDISLFSNLFAQPLIVAAGIACWNRIRDQIPSPAVVAGYSVGELTAYGVAGALSPIELVEIAAQRAALMDDCLLQPGQQVMCAVSGLPITDIASFAGKYALHVAIETGEDSAIIGGVRNQASAFEALVASRGGRCTTLPVRIASHTPLMAAAVAPFASRLSAAEFGSFQAPVLAGISARRISRKADAVEALSRQLTEPIRWLGCMDAMAEAGITVALELGPGSALARMLQSRHPHIASRSVADFRSLEGVTRWTRNSMERS